MVTIERRIAAFRYLLIFYPDPSELRAVAERIGPLMWARVRQATAPPTAVPHVVDRRVFRTACIDLTASEDEILGRMQASTRNLVRRALRDEDGFEVVCNGRQAAIDFLSLNREFASWNRSVPRVAPRRLRDYLPVSDVLVLYHDGMPVVGHLVIRDESVGRARLAYSASSRFKSREHDRVSAVANRYLHFHEFLLYKRKGFSLYDLGGIGSGTGSVGRFKLSFGGFRVEEHDCVLARSAGRLPYQLLGTARRGLSRLRRAAD